MHNILNMDLFRFRKTKATYVIYAAFIGFMALLIYTMKLSSTMDNAMGEFNTVADVANNMLQGNTAIFIIVIFIAIFVNAEFNSGYIKNIMGDVVKKRDYVFSKLVIITIYTTIFIITGVVLSIIAGKAVLHLEEFGNVGRFCAYIGVNYLLNLTLGYLMLLLTLILRNTAASTSIGVVYTLVLGNMMYQLINLAVAQIFKVEDFNISKYFVLGNLNVLTSTSSNGELIRGIVVSVIYGALAITASIAAIKRRDV